MQGCRTRAEKQGQKGRGVREVRVRGVRGLGSEVSEDKGFGESGQGRKGMGN